jgi:hypothetical protein
MLEKGRYRHYKGNEYELIDIATHSETEQKMVIYKTLYGNQSLWVRPLDMFIEKVNFNGKEVKRFQKI